MAGGDVELVIGEGRQHQVFDGFAALAPMRRGTQLAEGEVVGAKDCVPSDCPLVPSVHVTPSFGCSTVASRGGR